MNMLGTHDTERILTILEGKIEQLKIAVLLQMTLPGVPLIYYGDEEGEKVVKILIIESLIHGEKKI